MIPHCLTHSFPPGVWGQEKCISFRLDWSPSHWGDLGSLSNRLLAQKGAEGKKQVRRKGRREAGGRGGKRKREEKGRRKGRRMGKKERRKRKR